MNRNDSAQVERIPFATFVPVSNTFRIPRFSAIDYGTILLAVNQITWQYPSEKIKRTCRYKVMHANKSGKRFSASGVSNEVRHRFLRCITIR